ncbi:MAG: hypothetical protein ACYTFG_11850 [Planctomycetota bacterium]|jgi:hypothetical protein
MNVHSLFRIATPVIASVLLVLAGCPADKDDPPPPPDPVNVLLENGGGTGGDTHNGEVTVVVFDEQDDTRIQDATVMLDDGSGYVQQTTDATGTTVFTGVTVGTFVVTIAKTGFVNLSIFGVEASLLVMPLASARIQVDGTVLGGSASGTTYGISFATLEPGIFGSTDPLYGEIIKLPTGGDSTYTLMLDKGQTDTVTFTETDNSTGEIVNRKTLAVGPYAVDQTGVNVTFDGTTGLHEITGNLSNINVLTSTVGVYYKDGNTWYSAYNVSGSGVSRTYTMKLPPNQTCLVRLLADSGIIDPDSPTSEGQEFSVVTGPADNSTATTVNLAYDMVTMTGSFTNYGTSALMIQYLRYGNLTTVNYSLPAVGYTLRMPTNLAAQIAVVGVSGTIPNLVVQRALEQSYGPFSGSGVQDFDLAAASPLLLDVTTNIPANMSSHNPTSMLAATDANDDVVQPAFAASGTVNATDITYPIRRFERQNMNFIFMVSDSENSPSDAQTFFIKGNVTDPTTQLGTTENVTLLDVPGITSPTNGGNSPAQVNFAWSHDTTLDNQGFTMIEITNTTTQKRVWNVIVEAGIDSVTLPSLPGSLSGNELQTGTTYEWTAAALTVTNLDFDSFQIGMFQDLGVVVKGGRDVRLGGSDTMTFTIN